MKFYNHADIIEGVPLPEKIINVITMMCDRFSRIGIEGDIYLLNGEVEGEKGYEIFLHKNAKTYQVIQHVHREAESMFTGIVLEEQLQSKILSLNNPDDVISVSFVEKHHIEKIQSIIGEGTFEDEVHFDQCLNPCRCCGGLSELLIEITNNYGYAQCTTYIDDNSEEDMQTKIKISFPIKSDGDDDDHRRNENTDTPVPSDKKNKPITA